MARGGARKGAGRKRGSVTRKTAEIANRAAAEGITPLEYMLKLLRDEPPADADAQVRLRYDALRFEAAKAAAPYMHPRLNAIEHSGPGGGPMSARIEVTFVSAHKG